MLTLLLQPLAAGLLTLALTNGCARVPAPPTAAHTAAPTGELFTDPPVPADQSDDALANARRLDSQGRGIDGALPQLAPPEHMRRAAIYLANRAFAEARAHWQALISRYPTDSNVPAALFGMGRSLYVERSYAEALPFFERLGRDFAGQKEGREGFYYVAATLLRLGRPADAAAQYITYANRFPAGERIENAYLNAIDSYREADQPAEAVRWINFTRTKFKGTATDTNALFARLRLDVAGSDWASAIRTADELRALNFQPGVATSKDEVAYLRAYSLEQQKQTAQAAAAYQTINDRAASYYGLLATEHLRSLGAAYKRVAESRAASRRNEVAAAASAYPVPYRDVLLQAVKGRNIDPRFVLSIMRAESSYNPRARSQAGARGLLQLTIDAAAKYGPGAGLRHVTEDDLYRPEVNIPVGVEYLATLTHMFPDLPEAVAASYNGGEDNVARWVKRAMHKDNGVVAAEIGFAESKDYAFKVVSYYRVYKQLYTADLRRQR
ncbi:MAG TPA: transglycosylase SLT domain-containing protein [Pyrinomonadaceae bacterium]|jgi:soluble lytic murein transglycosylase